MGAIYRCRICGSFTEEPVHCGARAELLLDERSRTRLSKLMSGLLRHFPEAAGLKLDEEGFVRLEELLDGIRRWRRSDYSWVCLDHILAVAALDPKGRFEVAGERIRARYGHSVNVRIAYEEKLPPGLLYHGTSARNLSSIYAKGLLPMKRRFVHLTTRLEDAWRRAARYEDPVVLVVDPGCLARRSRLYRASSSVYLSPKVPPECIVKVLRPTGHYSL